MHSLTFEPDATLYFASDFHLGAPDPTQSRDREHRIIQWLDHISHDADAVFLVGDVFDFWFEYRTVVPKGFVRFQAALARLTDAGVRVLLFHGNHDMWMRDYFVDELGVEMIPSCAEVIIGDQRLYVGHGDGLGPGDPVYKILKAVFKNPIANWLFGWLHPDIGVWIATTWASGSRAKSLKKGKDEFRGEKEWLYQYARRIEDSRHHDYYLFGHRHLPIEMAVGEHSAYINLGEWVNYHTYALYTKGQMSLLTYED